MKALILTALFSITAASTALAGDKNSIWFRQQSALARAGFDNTACGKYPLPDVFIDGENNCAKVPTTFMYKLTKSDGTYTREVRKLEDTYEETNKITPDGTILESSVKVTSGRSVDGNFGRRQTLVGSLPLSGAFVEAETNSNARRTFSTGLAAARRSTQEPVQADQ